LELVIGYKCIFFYINTKGALSPCLFNLDIDNNIWCLVIGYKGNFFTLTLNIN